MENITGFLKKILRACPALPYLALGVWLIWVFILNSGTAWLSDTEVDGSNISTLYIITCASMGAVLVASSFLPKRWAQALLSPAWVIGGAAVSALGCLIVILIGPYYLTSVLGDFAVYVLFRFGALLGGVGSAPLLLKCAELYGGLIPRRAMLYTALSHIVAALTYFVIIGVPDWQPIAGGPSLAGILAFVLLPLGAALLACLSFVDGAEAPYEGVAGVDTNADDMNAAGAGCTEAGAVGGASAVAGKGAAGSAAAGVGVASTEGAAAVGVAGGSGAAAVNAGAGINVRAGASSESGDHRALEKPFLKLIAVVFVFSLVVAAVRAAAVQVSPVEQTYEVTRMAMLLRMLVATAFAGMAIAADAKAFDFGRIYAITMVAAVAVVALLPFVGVTRAFVSCAIMLVAFVFDLLLWCVLVFIMHQRRQSARLVVGRAYGCSYLGTGLGWAFGAQLSPVLLNGQEGFAVYLAMALLVLVSAFVLFSEKEFDHLFAPLAANGESLETLLETEIGADLANAADAQEMESGWFERAIDSVVEEYGLTERERDVLRCLAMGYGNPAIARELGISRNTARNHCGNIYAKLDMHAKQEVIDLVDDLRRSLRKP